MGARNHTDLGSVLVVGLGGVLVELTRTVVGRLLPLADGDTEAMLEELGGDRSSRGGAVRRRGIAPPSRARSRGWRPWRRGHRGWSRSTSIR